MMKIVGSIIVASLACAPALAEEPARVEAWVCFIADKPETYVFQFPSVGPVRLLNRDGASVTVSESIITAVLADTVLQFVGGSVQVLNNSSLAKWPCTDVTASILAIIKQTQTDANGLSFDAAVMAVVQALREKLKSSDAELTAMTLALEEQRKKAEDTLTLLAAADAATKDMASAKTQKEALLAAAQNILSQKDLQLALQARNVAILNQQLAALRAQLQGMPDAAAAEAASMDAAMAALDPAAYDAAKVTAVIDGSTLDDATKASLKSAVTMAGNDPIKLADVIAQVKKALGM